MDKAAAPGRPGSVQAGTEGQPLMEENQPTDASELIKFLKTSGIALGVGYSITLLGDGFTVANTFGSDSVVPVAVRGVGEAISFLASVRLCGGAVLALLKQASSSTALPTAIAVGGGVVLIVGGTLIILGEVLGNIDTPGNHSRLSDAALYAGQSFTVLSNVIFGGAAAHALSRTEHVAEIGDGGYIDDGGSAMRTTEVNPLSGKQSLESSSDTDGPEKKKED
jgi:hypothetical protein